eukprot:Lankesteria_metandrocarpae@DN4099_c0_g1_i1.p1
MTSKDVEEVVGFLSDPQGTVRLAATEILSGLVETETFKKIYLGAVGECPSRRKFLSQKVVRLIGDEEASEAAVKLLACMSAYNDFVTDIVICNGVSRVADNLMEQLRLENAKSPDGCNSRVTGGMHDTNKQTDMKIKDRTAATGNDAQSVQLHIEMSLVLLANLTRIDSGRRQFLKKDHFSQNEISASATLNGVGGITAADDHHPLRGAIFMNVLGEYLKQPGLSRIGKPQAVDSRSVIGNLLANLLVESCARKFIVELGVDVINRLSFFVLHKLRRPAVLHILKQIACDTTLHSAILPPTATIPTPTATIPTATANSSNSTATGRSNVDAMTTAAVTNINSSDSAVAPTSSNEHRGDVGCGSDMYTVQSLFIPHVCCCVYPSKASGKREVVGPKMHEVFREGGLVVGDGTKRRGTDAYRSTSDSANNHSTTASSATAAGATTSSSDCAATAGATTVENNSGIDTGIYSLESTTTAVNETVDGVESTTTAVNETVDVFAFGPVASEEERWDVYNILLQLCTTEGGRDAMRKQGVYEVFRVWHLLETNDDIKNKIEDIVHSVVYSEQELVAQDTEML